MKSFISGAELKWVLPRIALYSGFIAASTMLARIGVSRVSSFFGLRTEERDCK